MSNGDCPFKEFIEATADPAAGEALVDAFEADPDAVGAAHGLNPNQIEILRTGDKSAIRDELTAEATAHPECAKKHVWAPYGLMT
jgi:hypothetical protein